MVGFVTRLSSEIPLSNKYILFCFPHVAGGLISEFPGRKPNHLFQIAMLYAVLFTFFLNQALAFVPTPTYFLVHMFLVLMQFNPCHVRAGTLMLLWTWERICTD